MGRVKITEPVQDTAGNALSGASVQVNLRGGAAATLYSAETGATTVGNPRTSTATGQIEAWIEEGSYTFVTTKSGYTFPNHPFEASLAGHTVNVKYAPYGAKGDGVTDDTAAFTAALTAVGEGGTVYAPIGVYRVGDLAFTSEGQTIRGDGAGVTGGTRLKAKTSATYVVKNQGHRFQTLSNLVIDGNSRASRGLLTESTALATSQGLVLNRVWFTRCTVGFHLGPGAGGITQADKNTLYDCQFVECDVGLWNEATNGQNTILHNTNFISTYDTSVRMAKGTLTMHGGQFMGGSGTKGVEFTASGIGWAGFYDVIFEGIPTDVYGATGCWPNDGVTAVNTTFQGSTANVRMDTSSAKLYAVGCTFNDEPTIGSGQITCVTADAIIWLIGCNYAPPVIDGAQAATAHIIRENISGITLTNEDVIMDTATKGLVLKDTQGTPHYWRVTISNVGAIVTTDLGTTRP